MKLFLTIIIIASCLGIIYQDLKTRLISVLLFVILAGGLLYNHFLFNKDEDNNTLMVVNLLFVSAQILVLFFYFKFIKKKKESFFDSVFGLGDVIMLFCVALIFPLPQLIIFLLGTYLISFAFLLAQYLQKKEMTTIPLAGNIAICYVLVFFLNLLSTQPILQTFISC